MNINNLVVNYADKKLKEIKNSKFDVYTYSTMMEELNGEKNFDIDGIQYSFIDGFKRDGEDIEYNYGINDNVIADIFIGIYENLNEKQQEEFINEMLQHTDTNPYKATEYFEKIKREKEEEQRRVDESNDTSSETTEGNNNNEEVEETNDLSDDIPNMSVEEPTEEKEEPNKTVEEEKLSFDKNGPAITKYMEETKRLEEMLSKMNPTIEEEIPTNNEMYPEFEKDKAELERIKNEIENFEISARKKVEDEYEALKKKIEDAEFNKKTPSNEKDPEKNTIPNEDFNKLKQEIESRKEIEKLYFSCLEDIKALRDLVKSGLDPNSEAAKKIVERIDNKKMPLPDELKNELNEYLKMALARERKRIQNVEKNPKKTMRTYLALAAGLVGGGVLGFTLGATGILVANIAMIGAKAIVGYLQKEARNRRINGKKVEAIEEPSNKLKAAVQRFKEKAIQHEELLRDINWGLTGGLIGLNVGAIAKNMARTIELQKTVHNVNPTPNPTPTPSNTANIAQSNNIPSVGEHINGLEYGYKNSIDAAGHVNATHLNQAILNDGKTVIAGYRVGGQTLTNLPAGVTPDAVLLTDGTANGYRAWAAVEDVVNAVGRSL